MWVSPHIGITGNEKADAPAKNSIRCKKQTIRTRSTINSNRRDQILINKLRLGSKMSKHKQIRSQCSHRLNLERH